MLCRAQQAWGGKCENGALIEQASRTQDNHCGSCGDGYHLEKNECKANQFTLGEVSSNACPAGTHRLIMRDRCMHAAGELGKEWLAVTNLADAPRGCYQNGEHLNFNTHPVGAADAVRRLVCGRKANIYLDARAGETVCPQDYRHMTEDECREAAISGSVGAPWHGIENTGNWVRGCYRKTYSDGTALKYSSINGNRIPKNPSTGKFDTYVCIEQKARRLKEKEASSSSDSSNSEDSSDTLKLVECSESSTWQKFYMKDIARMMQATDVR